MRGMDFKENSNLSGLPEMNLPGAARYSMSLESLPPSLRCSPTNGPPRDI